jgi:hypothetical protein
VSDAIADDVAARVAEWLAQLDPECERDPYVTHTAVALAILCRRLGAAPSPAIAAATHADRLDFPACPLPIALVSCAALLDAGEGDARSRAVEYVQALESCQDGAPAAVQLALHGPPAPGAVAGLDAAVCDLRRAGTPEGVDDILTEIEEATGHGLRECDNTLLADLLEGVAMLAARRHDLPRAARALRCRLYAAPGPTWGAEAIASFLRSCQNPDGSFGAYDTSFARLARDGHAEQIARIRLRVAFDCTWALAEADGSGWRLLRAVFGNGLRAKARAATASA